MFYLYILYSGSCNKYYVGYSNNPHRRLIEHNTSEMPTYTSKHRPWVLEAIFACGEVEGEVVKIERFVKRQKSRKLIEQIIAGKSTTGILAQLVRVPHVRD